MTVLPKIPAPAIRALTSVKVMTLEDVAKKTEQELAVLHGMGPKGIRILKASLKEAGLGFKKS
ncbi:hypothetical protein BH11PAT4_BH11PAT4_3480 [soil metagenome]